MVYPKEILCSPALFANIGKKSHISCSLDGDRQISLMLSANARSSAGNDFSLFGNKLLQSVDVFIIDDGIFFGAEQANLLFGSAAHLFARFICFSGRSRGGGGGFIPNFLPSVKIKQTGKGSSSVSTGCSSETFLLAVRTGAEAVSPSPAAFCLGPMNSTSSATISVA